MTKINLHKLIAVLKENGCTPCQWNNVKCGDDNIVIESCKACFDQNTCLKNRKMIRRILFDRRNNILELCNRFEPEKKNFTNKVRAILNELPFEVKCVDSEIVIEICKSLGIKWNATKWKVEALKNHNKTNYLKMELSQQKAPIIQVIST